MSVLNDLWEFTPQTKEWTWMGGSANGGPRFDRILSIFVNSPAGIYGTVAHLSPTNVPGGRQGASSWTDRDGNLWLFGGLGFDSNGDFGYLNDLWEYRFLPAPVPAETPSFSLPEGTYTKTQYVSIEIHTPNSVIYYTLDGTAPTNKSTKYTAGITIGKTTTVRAIAVASGYESQVTTATYTILPLR